MPASQTSLTVPAAVSGIRGKGPAVNCPVCGAKARTRSSEEISPTYRRLYLACSEIRCSMTFTASLTFEHVLSPSGISAEFRAAQEKPKLPPGHEFGQVSMRDLQPPTIEN